MEIRSPLMLGVAYLLTPLVAPTLLWAGLTAPLLLNGTLQEGYGATGGAFNAWDLLLIFGGWFGVAVELVVVTPLLLGYARHRWSWLNGWSAAAIGFLVGAGPTFVLGALPPSAGEASFAGSRWLIIHGHRTLAGWEDTIRSALVMGVVGLLSAVVFRLVAARSVQD